MTPTHPQGGHDLDTPTAELPVVLSLKDGNLYYKGAHMPLPSYSAEALRAIRGRRISVARKARRLTGKQLGEAAGVSKSEVSRYESGAVTVPFDVAKRIAEALAMSVVDIADVPRVGDERSIVFHVHLPEVVVVQAAIAPVPDDRDDRETPHPMHQQREAPRDAVRKAVLDEVGAALDAFFERRTQQIETYRTRGRFGNAVDIGQSNALAFEPYGPPVTVYDVNPLETLSES